MLLQYQKTITNYIEGFGFLFLFVPIYKVINLHPLELKYLSKIRGVGRDEGEGKQKYSKDSEVMWQGKKGEK